MKAYGNPKTLHIDLNDERSIQNAIQRFVHGKEDVMQAAFEAIETLCAEGEKIAKSEAPEDSGDLRASITHKTVTEGQKVIGTITAGTDHAAFVEFGTGIVGSWNPHPYGNIGWEYDVNGHGYQGWVYPKNNRFYHTLGQKSNPFMYRTAKTLSEQAERILNEHIN